MRNYGLPQSYWSKDSIGTQEGFTNLIANDVSSMELEGRLQAAQTRVLNANPEVAYALKAFYPDITNVVDNLHQSMVRIHTHKQLQKQKSLGLLDQQKQESNERN